MSILILSGVSPKFFGYMVIKKIELILILLSGHVARAPTKGRLMGLPLPDIVI
jgi:hypothetical protein